jgi:hypothetical protein
MVCPIPKGSVMSIVHASDLSTAEMLALGNNVLPAVILDRTRPARRCCYSHRSRHARRRRYRHQWFRNHYRAAAA